MKDQNWMIIILIMLALTVTLLIYINHRHVGILEKVYCGGSQDIKYFSGCDYGLVTDCAMNLTQTINCSKVNLERKRASRR